MGYLSGGQHRVFVQAEDGVRRDGVVRQEAAAHDLRGDRKQIRPQNRI